MLNKEEKVRALFIGALNIGLNEKSDNISYMSVTSYYNSFKYKLVDFNIYSDIKIMFDPDTFDYLYEKVWVAFLDEDITLIKSVYRYSILQFFNYIEEHYKEIISDIRNHRVDPEKYISEEAKNYLLNLKFSEERLNFIEKECEKGFKGIGQRLWKNLRIISGISSKSLKSQNEALDFFLGNVKKDSYYFSLSEGLIGASLEYDTFTYQIEPSLGIFELLPYCQDKEDEEKNDEVKKDEEKKDEKIKDEGIIPY